MKEGKKLASIAVISAALVSSYLLSLLVHLPARWVAQAIPMPGELSLKGLSGTLWEGHVGEVHWKNYEVRDAGWSVQWRSLLQGKPAVYLYVNDEESWQSRLTVAYQRGLFETNGWFQTSANYLSNTMPQPYPVNAAGAIRMVINDFIFDSEKCLELDGRIRWTQAFVDSPLGQLTLGEPLATLSCVDEKVMAVVEQDSTALASQSKLALGMLGDFRGNSIITPGPNFSPQLKALLRSNAKEIKNGSYKIALSGHL